MAEKNKYCKNEISEIGITDDLLSGRGGLAFFCRYLKGTHVLSLITGIFDGLRKSSKGQKIENILKQIFCFFVDGSQNTMTRFDDLKNNMGYAGTIEFSKNEMASSHTMKRFLGAVTEKMVNALGHFLLELFIWRLKITRPKVIVLGVDSTVLDNNSARKREGVTLTYKMVKGFHPLLFYWGPYVIYSLFREGSAHCNHGNDLNESLEKIIGKIRKEYDKDVPVIVVSDSGFNDQKYYEWMEENGHYYICGGTMYNDIKLDLIRKLPQGWSNFERKGDVWEYCDFRDKREKWSKGRRAIYCKRANNGDEYLLDFAKPDNLIYTNLYNQELLKKAGLEKYLAAKEIIELYLLRAKDELVNRSVKEFADETLPFKRFISNAAYYFLMLISRNLLIAMQEDALSDSFPIGSYPDTVRRLFIDIAGKIVRRSRKIVLKFRA